MSIKLSYILILAYKQSERDFVKNSILYVPCNTNK